MEEKESRIRRLTHLYYSNPKIAQILLEFSKDREVVPRYFEGFGKRPDTLQYMSDINGLVKKGATSFHASEEIWENPLNLNSDMGQRELNEIRKSWDLLIDVDSKYLDVSKILTLLIVETLEEYGIKNYGIKFSGSKGFHIIVGGSAFPKEFNEEKMSQSFPAWPRAICEYLTHITRGEFNKRVGGLFSNVKIEEKESSKEALCPECGRPAKKGNLVVLECPVCKTNVQRKDMKVTKKRLKCIQDDCAGVFEIIDQKDYFKCEFCDDVSSISKVETSGRYKATYTEHAKTQDYSKEMKEEYSGTYFGASDLVLVAPRHLFRMPYSLHEKTSLASVVLSKEEIENFQPSDADPMKAKFRDFLPKNEKNEGIKLLKEALDWKKSSEAEEKKFIDKKYASQNYDNFEIGTVTEDMFPPAINKLLKGLEDGKKRGLFVLITFLRSLNFPPDYLNKKVREWNEKNSPPLKEGYIRSQIEWHLKQKKKILPPNYTNDAFYRDIGLISDKQKTKNPLVDVMKKSRRK